MATPRRNILVATAALALLLATPAALGQSLSERRSSIDNRISAVRDAIRHEKEREGVLSSEITAATDEIRSLGSDIGVLSSKLEELQSDLARFRARLAALEARYEWQTRHLQRLRRDHAGAQRTLERRLVELYESDDADTLEILLQVRSLGELIEKVDFMNEVGRQDRRIARTLARLKAAMRTARERTGKTKDEVEKATAVLAAKAKEAEAARATLVARQQALAAARADKRGLLTSVKEERHEHEEDLDSLLAASASIAAQIKAAQAAAAQAAAAQTAASPSTSSDGQPAAQEAPAPSSSGLIWPVSGPVTSGFGLRWGRMHEGIDISAPIGTAVRAAASGRVIIAGWMGGYGNLIVIDHGNGMSTAYGHLSAIWVGGGSVSQGQAIGAVGCTGSCTGPHLHFEVRINGAPVNPLGYL
ncbi:MAG: peptidoglycan DD-metalloendopeptidase family protein [Thermoleophilia bacterium]|nr:peptidoglycan DD-metalloendopeptidase family protein [Thermoleophilia bacterium]